MQQYLIDPNGRSLLLQPARRRPPSDFLGAEPELKLDQMNQQAALMKKRMIEAATEQAVAQMTVSIATGIVFDTAAGVAAATGAAVAAGMTAATAASVVPIVGWVVAALIAIGTLVGGSIAKKQIHKMIEGAKDEIQGYGRRVQATVQAAKNQVGEDEWAAAQALAASGQPLEGLGGFKDMFTHAIAKAQTKSVQVVGDAILKTGAAGARLVGDKKGEAKAKKWNDAWDRNSKRVDEMFAKKLNNPYHMFAEDIDAIGRTFSGQQAVHVVRNKIGSMVAAAKRDMDEFRDKTLSMVGTPEYHEATRINLAKGLRGDPQFAQRAQELQARDKMVAAAFTSNDQVTGVVNTAQGKPADAGGGAGALGTAAALIGAFFMFR